jgi:hypothetical protein
MKRRKRRTVADTEIVIEPGHQHNFRRLKNNATPNTDAPTELQPGQKLILRTGGATIQPPPGAVLIQPGHQHNFTRAPGPPYVTDPPTTIKTGQWVIVE